MAAFFFNYGGLVLCVDIIVAQLAKRSTVFVYPRWMAVSLWAITSRVVPSLAGLYFDRLRRW